MYSTGRVAGGPRVHFCYLGFLPKSAQFAHREIGVLGEPHVVPVDLSVVAQQGHDFVHHHVADGHLPRHHREGAAGKGGTGQGAGGRGVETSMNQ